MLRSNESMGELIDRMGLEIDPKRLNKLIEIGATRGSNIIDLKLGWSDGKQSIDMVNMLMQITAENTASKRKETLAAYAIETQLQFESANERVASLRDRVVQLRQERDSRLTAEDGVGAQVERLTSRLTSTEDALDEIAMRRVSLNRSLSAIKNETDLLRNQIRDELVDSRLQQIETLQKIYTPKTQKWVDLQRIKDEIERFVQTGAEMDYLTFRAKLEAIGASLLGAIDPASLTAVNAMERKLSFNEAKIAQVEFELLPMDSEVKMYESRRDSLERRLADAIGAADMNSTVLEEAQAELDEAIASRGRLMDQLNNIRRGKETDFSEIAVLTAASWQTTETSDGRLKLFVFTFAGCFVVLVMPVFALEYFFPSGDPAEHAARALGIPHVSRGTFLLQPYSAERRQLHPVNSESMRLLALRIQQSMPGSGAMVLFSGLDHDKSAIPMISYLAECLARREERVLIIDACERRFATNTAARDSNAGVTLTPINTRTSLHGSSWAGEKLVSDKSTGEPAAGDKAKARSAKSSSTSTNSSTSTSTSDASPTVLGLSDFLQRQDVGIDDMLCSTSIPGVDIISSGSADFPREGLAASSLTSLFDECRQRYTIILVAGPATLFPSDLQMLCARADGILFTVTPSDRPSSRGEDVVRDLLDMGAPVIGIVS
jgi:Mrp family chromosome partitioning ATPase